MRTNSQQSQRGAALVVGLIMLVLVTVMLISALVMSTSGFRSVSNMQFREEAIAALLAQFITRKRREPIQGLGDSRAN